MCDIMTVTFSLAAINVVAVAICASAPKSGTILLLISTMNGYSPVIRRS